MILRRITKHVKDQNWFAVGLDFCIVVVGILIAFQITNWSEARSVEAQHEVYIERLDNDFGGIRARLNLHLRHYQDAIEGGDYVLSLIKMDDTESIEETVNHDRLEKAINSLVSPRISPGPAATYLEMQSEGQLSGVQPVALRDKLAEYNRLLGIVRELDRVVLDRSAGQEAIIYRHVDPLLTMNADNLSGIALELNSYDLKGMQSDKEFAIAVKLLRQDAMNALGQRQFQLQLIDEIMTMLNEEIGT